MIETESAEPDRDRNWVKTGSEEHPKWIGAGPEPEPNTRPEPDRQDP